MSKCAFIKYITCKLVVSAFQFQPSVNFVQNLLPLVIFNSLSCKIEIHISNKGGRTKSALPHNVIVAYSFGADEMESSVN